MTPYMPNMGMGRHFQVYRQSYQFPGVQKIDIPASQLPHAWYASLRPFVYILLLLSGHSRLGLAAANLLPFFKTPCRGKFLM